jgi:putative ABC transport system permease protein
VPGPHVYFPMGQAFQAGVWIHARTRAASAEAEAALLPSFRREVMAVDPAVPILSLETRPMFRDRNALLAVIRMGATIFTSFGIVALFMAAAGVYGVKAYVVSRRTREIGIRIALGATSRRVIWMVLRDGLVASIAGIVVGGSLAVLAGTAMRSLTYQNQSADAVVLGGALVVLVATMLLASVVPARRATKIAPLRALRD